MATTRICDSVASGMLAVLAEVLDSGGYINIFGADGDTGIPTTCDVDISGSSYVIIASCDLSADAFTAVDSSGSTSHYIEANTITSDTGASSGVALFFRAYDSGDAPIIQGDCGTASTSDMVMNTTTVAAGATVNITSWIVVLPEHVA